MSTYVDAHCHLDLLPGIHLQPQVEDIAAIKSLTVTNAPYLFEHNQRLFADCKNIRVGLGFHPEVLADPRLVQQLNHQLAIFDTQLPAARYIGEVGLDGSTAWKPHWAKQITVLRHVATRCEQNGNKVITAHSRLAVMPVLEHLATRKMRDKGNQLILHWFSGTVKELAAADEAGAYFSINHRMMRSNRGREAVALMPRDRVITESDAPFTLDADTTTRLNSLTETVRQLSILWGMPLEQTQLQVWDNFRRLLTR